MAIIIGSGPAGLSDALARAAADHHIDIVVMADQPDARPGLPPPDLMPVITPCETIARQSVPTRLQRRFENECRQDSLQRQAHRLGAGHGRVPAFRRRHGL